MHTGFSNINTRVNDLTTRLETLGLHTNMNQGRREACTKDDARSQPVNEPAHANPHGQYDYKYSSNEEDRGKVVGNNRYDQDYRMKVEISPFGGDKRVEEFLDWIAKCD